MARRVGLGLLALFGLYTLIGFLVVPRIVESQLESILEERLGVTPEIGRVAFHPFRLRLSVEDFELPDPRGDQAPLAFGQLAIDLRLLGFLSADVALDEILLVDPRIAVVVDDSGRLNFLDLIDRFSKTADADTPPAGADAQAVPASDPFIFVVDSVGIERGNLSFVDRSQTPPFEIRVEPFDVSIEGLTSRQDVIAPYSLLLKVGDQTELRWSGTLGLEPIRSEGEIELSRFDLTVPWDYLSGRLRFEVTDGQLDVSARYALDLSDGLSLAISQAAIGTRDIEIVDPSAERPTFSLPGLSVTGVEASLDGGGLRSLAVEEVLLEGGRLATSLDEDGQLRLVELLRPVQDAPTTRSVDTSTTQQAEGSPAPRDSEPATQGDGGSPAPAAEVGIERVALEDFEIEIEDRGPSSPVTLRASELALEVRGFRSAPGTPLELRAATRLGESGRVTLAGPVVLEPLSAQLALELRGLALADFESYLESVARLEVVTGSLAADLSLDVRDAGDAAPRVAVKGRLEIEDLSTRDPRLGKEFVGWDRFAIEGLDLDDEHVRIAEIVLSGARSHLLLDRQGRSNLEAIFAGEDASDADASAAPAKPEASAQPGEPLAIEVAKLSLDGLQAELVDQSIEPPFRLSLDGFGGTIEGLSSRKQARARVALAGKVDGVAPLRIEGEVNPLSSAAFTDLSLTMSGVSLPAFSPYSGRFVGYRIDRGKLALDLHYELEKGHLKAKNLIKLQRFDFGQRVESEQATTLPVGLALAVMKDSAGDIVIPLPIEGDLDDPGFDVLQVLRKTLVNLITRVATAPFSVVAGLVGRSADDLSQVVFEPGRLELVEGEEAGLVDVAKLLETRPELRLEVRGTADPELEASGLRRARIEHSLRERHFASLSRSERARLGSPEAVVFDEEDRLSELERLYREQIGGSPADRLSPEAAGLPSAERARRRAEAAEAALASQLELEPEAWLELARARAARVQSLLVERDLVSAERIFLVDPEVGPGASPDDIGVALSLGVD